MKIHGMCLIKNEADILPYSLRESAKWCDFIYLFDTGSRDGSWEVIAELARELPQVIPFRCEPRNFDDALRLEIFNAFKPDANEGDWWCRLDADEVYVDNPKEFLAEVPTAHQVVWAISINHYFTPSDLAPFLEGGAHATPEEVAMALKSSVPPGVAGAPSSRNGEREISAETLPRFYSANWSEPRFFRHRNRLVWTESAWPKHLGLVTPKRIRLNHYQYRSPSQIQLRLDTRREAAASGWAHFGHSQNEQWQEKITPEESLHFDALDGQYVIDESKLPAHREPKHQRFIKRVLHGIGFWP